MTILATFDAWTRLTPIAVEDAINRHITLDWGPISEDEIRQNMENLLKGGPIISRYCTLSGINFTVRREILRGDTIFIIMVT